MCLSTPKTPKITPAPPPPPPPNAAPEPVAVSDGAIAAGTAKRKKLGRNSLRIGLGIPGDSNTGLSIPASV